MNKNNWMLIEQKGVQNEIGKIDITYNSSNKFMEMPGKFKGMSNIKSTRMRTLAYAGVTFLLLSGTTTTHPVSIQIPAIKRMHRQGIEVLKIGDNTYNKSIKSVVELSSMKEEDRGKMATRLEVKKGNKRVTQFINDGLIEEDIVIEANLRKARKSLNLNKTERNRKITELI